MASASPRTRTTSPNITARSCGRLWPVALAISGTNAAEACRVACRRRRQRIRCEARPHRCSAHSLHRLRGGGRPARRARLSNLRGLVVYRPESGRWQNRRRQPPAAGLTCSGSASQRNSNSRPASLEAFERMRQLPAAASHTKPLRPNPAHQTAAASTPDPSSRRRLTSIHGIGTLLAAEILAEAGDQRFPPPAGRVPSNTRTFRSHIFTDIITAVGPPCTRLVCVTDYSRALTRFQESNPSPRLPHVLAKPHFRCARRQLPASPAVPFFPKSFFGGVRSAEQ